MSVDLWKAKKNVIFVPLKYPWHLQKLIKWSYLSPEAILWKNTATLFSQIFKVGEKKVPLFILTLYGQGGGQICPPLHKFLNFLFSLYKHMLRLVDFSCMSITVLLQKKLASYVPWFNFDSIFFDKKSGFQIANFFNFFLNFAKKSIFPG